MSLHIRNDFSLRCRTQRATRCTLWKLREHFRRKGDIRPALWAALWAMIVKLEKCGHDLSIFVHYMLCVTHSHLVVAQQIRHAHALNIFSWGSLCNQHVFFSPFHQKRWLYVVVVVIIFIIAHFQHYRAIDSNSPWSITKFIIRGAKIL